MLGVPSPSPGRVVAVRGAPALAPLAAGTPDFDQRPNGLRALLDDEAWVQAAEEIVRFQREQPDYRRAETDRLLYDAYLNAGLALLDSRSVESGLYYLTLAGKLGDLPQEALDRRGWAELYLKGISFYAVDWQATIVNFRDLCLAAPFYQNSCDVLYDALVAFGDQFASAGEWCPAEGWYREALRYDSSSALREKVSTAIETCLIATPTPEAPITDTLPIEDGTPPVPVDQP